MTDALKLFLVEDDDNQRLEIRDYLVRRRHKVVACRTFAEARSANALNETLK